MQPFIYVATETDKNKCISLGYQLLKSNNKDLWVFAADDKLLFSEDCPLKKSGVRFVLSDILTF